MKLRILFLMLVTLLLWGCASVVRDTGVVAVEKPKSVERVVFQLDNEPWEEVSSTRVSRRISAGPHRMRVSYAGQVLMDSIITVSPDNGNARAALHMGAAAIGIGSIFLVVNTFTAELFMWLTIPFLTMGPIFAYVRPDTVFKIDESNLASSIHLFSMENRFFSVPSHMLFLGPRTESYYYGVISIRGACYDGDNKILWVQGFKDDGIYPIQEKSVETCNVLGTKETSNGAEPILDCDARHNVFFEKIPCGSP